MGCQICLRAMRCWLLWFIRLSLLTVCCFLFCLNFSCDWEWQCTCFCFVGNSPCEWLRQTVCFRRCLLLSKYSWFFTPPSTMSIDDDLFLLLSALLLDWNYLLIFPPVLEIAFCIVFPFGLIACFSCALVFSPFGSIAIKRSPQDGTSDLAWILARAEYRCVQFRRSLSICPAIRVDQAARRCFLLLRKKEHCLDELEWVSPVSLEASPIENLWCKPPAATRELWQRIKILDILMLGFQQLKCKG